MRHKELEKNERGLTIMNKKNLAIICERDELYSFPELNDKLYLHYKGIAVEILKMKLGFD